MSHRSESGRPKKSGNDTLGVRALIFVTLAIALPWLGFQILEDDPAQRPALLDTALAGLVGIWITRLSVSGGDKQ